MSAIFAMRKNTVKSSKRQPRRFWEIYDVCRGDRRSPLLLEFLKKK
jgi:hypothetical protein